MVAIVHPPASYQMLEITVVNVASACRRLWRGGREVLRRLWWWGRRSEMQNVQRPGW